jgi:hypothetical protein
MMPIFFRCTKSNADFSLSKALLREDGFEWLSPSGNLVGYQLLKLVSTRLNKKFRVIP